MHPSAFEMVYESLRTWRYTAVCVPMDSEGASGRGGHTPGAFQSKTVITSRSRRKWEKRISGVAHLGLGECLLSSASVLGSQLRWSVPECPGLWAPLFYSSTLNAPQNTSGELKPL